MTYKKFSISRYRKRDLVVNEHGKISSKEELHSIQEAIIDTLNYSEFQINKANEVFLINRLPKKKSHSTFIYLMKNRRNGYVKIGKSEKPSSREKTLQSEEPEVSLYALRFGAGSIETKLHRKYSEQRIRGEWFNLTDDQIAGIVSDYGFNLQ